MRKNRLLSAAVLLGISLLSLNVLSQTPDEPPPLCDGNPIEVLVENDCGMNEWILVTDSSTVCDIICQIDWTETSNCLLTINWIGGVIMEDSAVQHGFFFDPNTIMLAETTLVSQQTDLCRIAEDPDDYDAGFWYIPVHFVEYMPAIKAEPLDSVGREE